jgi:hypothetical protein
MRVCLRVLVKSNRRKLLALRVTWQVRAVHASYPKTRKALFLSKKQEEEGKFSPFAHELCRIPNIPIDVLCF